MKNRYYAFLIPWFMDGALSMVGVAVPLLALKYGASAMMLGTLGWVPQVIRLPLCLTSGRLSERFGRKAIIVPAAAATVVGSLGIVFAHTSLQILFPYAIAMAASGAFYPPLQAWVGEMSGFGELRKNLGAFNLGWCIGAAVAAWLAALIVTLGLHTVLYVGVCWAALSLGLLLCWRSPSHHPNTALRDEPGERPNYPSHILFIARFTTFAGFFGTIAVKMLFPKLAQSWNWTDAQIARVLAMEVAGLAVSMILCNISPWWRGKVWPQIAAQLVYLICGAVVLVASSPVLCGISFFGVGAATGVAYTAALYHGLSTGKHRGKNTGIHEGLVSSAAISACLIGGWTAEKLSLLAPYSIFCGLSAICLLVTFTLLLRHRSVQA